MAHRVTRIIVFCIGVLVMILSVLRLHDGGQTRHVASLEYDLTARLLSTPRVRSEFAVIAFTNYGMLNMTLNWLASLESVGISACVPLLICFDSLSYAALKKWSLNAFLVTHETYLQLGLAPTNISSELTRFGTQEYTKVVQLKMLITEFIVLQRVPHIFSDVDVVLWNAKPRNAFDDMIDILNNRRDQRGISMLIQEDERINGFSSLCTGFFIIRPTAEIQNLFRQVTQAMATDDGKGNQASFNKVCYQLNCQRYTEILPPLHYMSGLAFATAANATQSTSIHRWTGEVPYMIHANYLVGDEKEAMLRSFGLWLLDDRISPNFTSSQKCDPQKKHG